MKLAYLFLIAFLSSCATFPAHKPEAVRIVRSAQKWEGKSYRPGRPRQCANFVAEVVRDAGLEPPRNAAMARAWLAWGRSVPPSAIAPGDVVILWRGSPRGRAGHILVATGNGEAIHRSTYRAPVKRVPIAIYRNRIIGVRRPT